MHWLDASIKWIMIVAGLLTATMFQAAIDPRGALRSNFGETLEGPVAEIVVRNWGALIGMVGLLLLYGAFRPETRRAALLLAAGSKAVFIGLLLSIGRPFLHHGAGIAVIVDSILVVLFAAYLLTSTTDPRAAA